MWFHNPYGRNTTLDRRATVLEAAVPSPAAVYGSSYPDKGEYPAGLSPSTQAPLSFYTVPASQAYVVTGGKKTHTIQHNHRLGRCTSPT